MQDDEFWLKSVFYWLNITNIRIFVFVLFLSYKITENHIECLYKLQDADLAQTTPELPAWWRFCPSVLIYDTDLKTRRREGKNRLFIHISWCTMYHYGWRLFV